MPTLKQIEEKINDFLPKEVGVTNVSAEGPKIVLTTDRMDVFIDHSDIIKDLAREIKKRIIIRPPTSQLIDPADAEPMIKKIAGEESGITDIMFNPYQKEVMIEAAKLGNVIGTGGENIRKILKATGWTPVLERATSLKSNILTSLRKTLWDKKVCRRRKEFLENLGKQIYSEPDHTCDWIRVTPLGGAAEVGRSSFLTQTPNTNVLLDCGINVAASDPKRMFPDFRAMQLTIDDLDAVILSHSHLDHCGFIPYLYRYGFDGPIYATKPTRDIMALLQLDAMEISIKEDKELPYSSADIKNVIEHVVPLEYEEVADISTDMRLTLYNAGHILGSSVVHLHIGDSLYNILYTGDLKFGETRLLNPAQYSFPRLETLIMESTYGGRKSVQPKRKDAEEQLISTIKKTLSKGGKVLIPVFGVGRSQEVLVTLDEYKNELSDVPIYIDGMVYEATAIHTAYPEYLKRRLTNMILRGANPFLTKNFQKVDAKTRVDLAESTEPSIIITPSGMLSVDYDEPLVVKENGKAGLKKIGEVVDSLIEEKNGEPQGPHEYCVVDTEDSGIEVVGMNKDLKLEYSSVKTAIRHKITEPLYEITTETGRSVRCTASHSVFALRDGKIIATEASNLSLDDYLIAPKKLPELPAVKTINFVDELLKLDKKITKTIAVLNVVVDGKLKKEIRIDSLRGENWQLTNESRISFTVGRRYSLPAKIKVSAELARLLAYYVAEGSATFTSRGAITRLSFGPKEAEMAKDAVECAKELFGIQTKVEDLEERRELRVTLHGGKMLAYLIKHVFGAGVGAKNKRVPQIVLSFEQELREEFIKTYLKCDGSIYKSSGSVSVEFDTVSHKLASDLLYLLSSVGIVGTFSEVNKKARVIRGRQIAPSKEYRVSLTDKLQIKRICDMLGGKWTRFNEVLDQYTRLKSPVFARLPTNHTGLRSLFANMPKNNGDLRSLSAALARERMSAHRAEKALELMESEPERFSADEKEHISYLKKLVSGDLGVVKIKKIRRVKPTTPYVYDVSVDANESFIGGFGGLLLHNTGGPSVEYFKRMAGNEKDMILFVGYQAEGSLGRRVQKGLREVVIMENGKPKNIEVKIQVTTVEGFSGHADRRQLLGYVKRMYPKPERILCVHGEQKKCQELARGLNKIFHVETRVPMNLDTIRIL